MMSFFKIFAKNKYKYWVYKPRLQRTQFFKEYGCKQKEMLHYRKIILSFATKKKLEVQIENWVIKNSFCFL